MEDPSLTREALEIARALLISGASEYRLPVDDEMLTRFAAGLVSTEEHEQVVAAMTRSDELRGRFLRLRKELATNRHGLGELLAKTVTAYQELTRRVVDLTDPFTASALRTVGRQIAAELSGTRWATVRSGVGESVAPWTMTVQPSGLPAQARAQISEEGALAVTVQMSEGPAYLDLCLRDPVFGSILLGRSAVKDGQFEFEVPGFTETLGIDQIDPSLFLLAEAQQGSTIESGALRAETPFGEAVYLPLIGSLFVSDRTLYLAVAVSSDIRQRMAGLELQLHVMVGSLSVPIASVRVSDLEEDEVRFQTELGEVPDGDIAGSAFRLRFTPSEAQGAYSRE